MSQTMIAVFLASHFAGCMTVLKRPLPGRVSTRLRKDNDSVAGSAANVEVAAARRISDTTVDVIPNCFMDALS